MAAACRSSWSQRPATPVSGRSHPVPAERTLQQVCVALGTAGLEQRCGSYWALADGARHVCLVTCEHHHWLLDACGIECVHSWHPYVVAH